MVEKKQFWGVVFLRWRGDTYALFSGALVWVMLEVEEFWILIKRESQHYSVNQGHWATSEEMRQMVATRWWDTKLEPQENWTQPEALSSYAGHSLKTPLILSSVPWEPGSWGCPPQLPCTVFCLGLDNGRRHQECGCRRKEAGLFLLYSIPALVMCLQKLLFPLW